MKKNIIWTLFVFWTPQAYAPNSTSHEACEKKHALIQRKPVDPDSPYQKMRDMEPLIACIKHINYTGESNLSPEEAMIIREKAEFLIRIGGQLIGDCDEILKRDALNSALLPSDEPNNSPSSASTKEAPTEATEEVPPESPSAENDTGHWTFVVPPSEDPSENIF